MSVSVVSCNKIYFLYGKEEQNVNGKTHVCYGYTGDEKKNGKNCRLYGEWGSKEAALLVSIFKLQASTMEESSLGDSEGLDVARAVILTRNDAYEAVQEPATKRISRFAQALFISLKHGLVRFGAFEGNQLGAMVSNLVVCAMLPFLFNVIVDRITPEAQAAWGLKTKLIVVKRFVPGFCALGAVMSLILLSGFFRNFEDCYNSYYNEFGPPNKFYKLLKLKSLPEI